MCLVIDAADYLYPVMEVDNKVYLLHQSDDELHLLEWNPDTLHVTHALASWHTPVNVTLLPNKQSFSFIDNDVIKVKGFNQRTPHIISIDMPLYNFTILHWLDNESFFCSACKQGGYGIFQISYDGEVQEKVFDSTMDCLYPQKVGSNLYYIARKKENDLYYYSIRRCPYNQGPHSPLQDEIYIDSGTLPLAFLSLHPVEGEGVLSYDFEDSSQEEVVFNYYIIFKRCLKKAFSFVLSKKILFDPINRLYESLLPLVPRVRGSSIYFVSSDGLYSYKDGIIEKKANSIVKSSVYTIPLISGLYGGSLNESVFSYIQHNNESSLLCIKIPHI